MKNSKKMKKDKPVFDMHGASHLRTICEVLREINDMHQVDTDHDKKTRKKLREAQIMAKKMSNKLLDHNKEVFAGWWDENPDYEEDLRRRINSGYLQE